MEARKIGEDSLVDLMLHLKWKSEAATHTDAFQANRVNIWRDFLPPNFLKGLMGRQAGERIEVPLEAEDLVPEFNNRHLFQVKKSQFGQQSAKGKTEAPEVGRFYPKGLLKDLTDVFATNVKPFRCVQLDKDQMTVDFNHPLAGKELALSTVIGEVDTKRFERGGASIDWFEALTSGPGMQARWQNTPSQFFTEEAFRRKNEEADARFYKNPRLVQHIDDTAIEIVKDMYSGLLKDGMQVLDLMSSWQSHLPDDLTLGRLVGLGMNENELKSNPHLNETIVQDLNDNSTLPFDTGVFDAALCSLSIEYLVDPIAVFEEISRVLRPGGQFIVTFSNRWFPPKAVSIWSELHEFERMGLVLEYFLRSGKFNHLHTYSMRGLPRPRGDKYFPDLMYSDPVYAVWGQKL
jgi:FKBP-type peptidyl-prolyl cis-trans isomerase 2